MCTWAIRGKLFSQLLDIKRKHVFLFQSNTNWVQLCFFASETIKCEKKVPERVRSTVPRVMTSSKKMPNEYTSTFLSYFWPRISSGALKYMLPQLHLFKNRVNIQRNKNKVAIILTVTCAEFAVPQFAQSQNRPIWLCSDLHKQEHFRFLQPKLFC